MKDNKNKKKIKTPRKKDSPDYLNNKEMLKEVIKCQKEKKISDKLAKMFMLLTLHYSSKPWFSGWSYKNDLKANGNLACVIAFPKFNKDKSSNPFAYFTQCIHHSYIQMVSNEYKHQKIRDKLLVEAKMLPSFNFQDNENIEIDN